MIVRFRSVVMRLGPPEQFLQSFGSGRCSRCGRISALNPCNWCAGRLVRLVKREAVPVAHAGDRK